MQQIFEEKTLKSFFVECAKVVARTDIQEGNQHQQGTEDADAGEIEESPEMGNPLIGIIKDPYWYIPYRHAPPCRLNNYLDLKLKLRGVKPDVLELMKGI